VHPAGERVLAFRDAGDLDAAVFKLGDDGAGFGEVAAEPVELVDQQPFDLAGFGVGQLACTHALDRFRPGIRWNRPQG